MWLVKVKMFLLIILSLLTCSSARVVNVLVHREIDLRNHMSREKTTILVKNYGEAPLKTYIFVLPPGMKNYFIEFSNSADQKLHYSQNFSEINTFTVHLDRTVMQNESYQLLVRISSIDDIKARTKKRIMAEIQILFYTGNVYFYSPYKTFSLRVVYTCKTNTSHTASCLPHYVSENQLYYAYSNVIPYQVKDINISFASKDSIFAVTNLDRTIDVSHWGKILIEDKIILKNIGPHLFGPYEPSLGLSRPWLYTHLPASAEDVKYLDEIGNNSKSQMLYSITHSTFRHQARYNLEGGWKTTYVLQYKVPTYEYLEQGDDDIYLLCIRAIDHIVNDSFIETATVKVLLPEGAVLKNVSVPHWFDVRQEEQQTHLCFSGRETVVLNGTMLMENHIADVLVMYEFPELWLLKAPFLLAMYLQFVFTFVILVNNSK